MKAIFIHDTFYSRAPDGKVYAFGAFPANLWAERFLPHFKSLTVIGREKPFDPSDAQTAIRADGPGVNFLLLPNINTPMARILSAAPIINAIREQVEQVDAVIIRGPSELGMIAAKAVRNQTATKVNIPVAIEMSGCAFDHTWHHGSLTGKLYAPAKYLRARHMVKNADSVIYVTKSFLQTRYPTHGTVVNASNVEIEAPSSSVLQNRLKKIENRGPVVFGLIGNYGNKLKGLDVAINALARIEKQLPPFQLRILGHGTPSSTPAFVHFDAPLSQKQDVLNWLDGIDIYLQPSRHEGLPRALIEAMSRACPALASNAGGISELLDSECLHRRGDGKKLALQIINALNPDWRKRQAQRNFETAQNYTREQLLPIRENFWSEFAALTRARKTQNLLVSRSMNTFSLNSNALSELARQR